MLFSLAQTIPETISPEDEGIYQAVKQGVQSGIESTASSRPSEWLMVLLSLVITYFFLRQQRSQQISFSDSLKQKDTEAAKKDNIISEAVAAMNVTILATQAKFAEDAKISQKECHNQALALKEGQGILHEIAHDFKDAIMGIREQTASQERIAEAQRESMHSLKNSIQQLKLMVELDEARRQQQRVNEKVESIVIIDPPAGKDKSNAS